MPLIDLDALPARHHREWPGFNLMWSVEILKGINPHLPPGYHGGPYRHDPLARRYDAEPEAEPAYSPPPPACIEDVSIGGRDSFELRIRNESNSLAGAVLLVGSSIKEQPPHDEWFIIRCADLLRRGVGLLVVDIVASWPIDLHRMLAERLGLQAPALRAVGHLGAASYRVIGEETTKRLEAWTVPFAIGQPLPPMPLWIAPRHAVPVDLEASFVAACDALRIPVT